VKAGHVVAGGIVVAALAAATGAHLLSTGAAPALRENPSPDIEACRRDPAARSYPIPSWDGAVVLAVTFSGHAAPSCPAPVFPFVHAAATPGMRWIQIVEVNVPPPRDLRGRRDWDLRGEENRWTFLDMMESLRGQQQPFVNDVQEGWFWDNPAWLSPPRRDQAGGARVWQARSYAVRVADREVTAIGGFSWGYGWRVGAPEPYPIEPRPLPRSAWVDDAHLFGPAAPGWPVVP
jgi:hypothetical protein